MPINFDPNSLNNVFDKNFGAGAYNTGLSNARNAAMLKVKANYAQQDMTKRINAARTKALKDQEYMTKYGMTKDQYDAQQAQKKANSTFNSAMNYWSDKKDQLQGKGAYRAANDLINDPRVVEDLKNQGYDVSKIVDAAYNVASNGKFASKKSYDQYATQLDKSNTDKKANMDSIDAYIAKAKQQEADQKAQKTAISNAKNGQERTGFLGFLDSTLGRIGNTATQLAFGKGFNDAQNQNYQTIANAKLKQNPNDKAAIANLQMQNTVNRQAKNGLEKTADFIGGTAGVIAPYTIGGAYGLADAALGKIGLNAIKNPIAKDLVRGIGAGAIGASERLGTHRVASNEKLSPSEYAKQIGTEAALAGGGDAALGALGRGIMKILSKGKQAPVQEAQQVLGLPAPKQQETLGLPAPQLRLNAPQLQLEAPKIQPSLDTLLNVGKKPNGLQNPIPQMPDKLKNIILQNDLKNSWADFAQGSKSLPKARPQYITNLDLPADPFNRGPQYWQQRYNDFVKFAHDNGYNENNLSHDAINELWTHFAKNDEPVNINQVVDLAYTKGYEVPPQQAASTPIAAPMQPSEPNLKDLLSGDPRIKQKIQALFPNGSAAPKISRPATLEEMVQNLESQIPPKQAQAPLEPLQFRKLTDMERQIKPKQVGNVLPPLKGDKNSNLLLPLGSLKADNLLKTVTTNKTLDRMSKEELQTVAEQLQSKKETLAKSKSKASKKRLAAVEKDLKKVNDFLMKSDLQMFGKGAENAAKKKTGASQSIPPKERKAQKQAVANFVDKAKKAGIPKAVRKEVQQAENAGAMLKGAKNINQMIDRLPKETGDQLKTSLKMVEELKKSKDILPTQTLTKNVYELAAKLPKEMGDYIISEFDKAKAAHVNNMEQRTNVLYDKIVKGLGIQKGSKESALVQDFGEKTLAKRYLRKRGIDPSKLSDQELNNVNLQQLKKLRPDDWQNIVEADNFFRKDYKKMIGEVNATVKKIYPNNPDKLVPERQDYYHHFNELQGFEGFKNLVQNSSAIDPHLAGISPDTKPNSKWQAFKQMRGNGKYTSDAVGGYLKYLQAASHSTHLDPLIKVLRNTADQIASATEGTRNLNNLKSALEVHANQIAGKTNPLDRPIQDHVVGRKIMNIANVVNSHIKKNMILGNLGSALGQLGNVPLAIGKAKQYAGKGALDTLQYAASHLLGGSEKNLSAPIQQSKFLKERFSGDYFRRFETGFLKKPEKMAAWLIETADKSGTYFTWNSMYQKGLAKGVADPIKYADAETRSIVAGRGVGEVPVAQRSKIVQLVAPFSLEVGNQWKVLGKQVSEKDFGGIVTFLAASYGLNEAMNHLKGSDASYNPIGALIQGINQDQMASGIDKTKNGLANLLGETVGNIPGGNYIPQVMGLINQNQKQAIFGDRSPDRFGTGLGAASTVFKPANDLIGGSGVKQATKDLLPLVLPFGGNQAKKTWNGIEALAKGGAYNNKGRLQYPVDASNPSDLLHSLLIGPTTTGQGRDYYNNNRQPLSDKQTAQYQNTIYQQDYYNNLRLQQQVKSIQKKLSDINKDQSLTPQQKQQKALLLVYQLQNLQK